MPGSGEFRWSCGSGEGQGGDARRGFAQQTEFLQAFQNVIPTGNGLGRHTELSKPAASVFWALQVRSPQHILKFAKVLRPFQSHIADDEFFRVTLGQRLVQGAHALLTLRL